MAITRYAGDRFTTNTSDTKPTGVLDGAYLIDTGNLTQYVRRSVGGTSQWAQLAGGGGGGGTPGGANTQVQFNNAGAFGGSTGLTFDGQRLYANNLQISGIIYDSNNSYGEGGMVLTNEGTTGVNWKSIESVLSGVGGSGVANYVARWSDEDTLTSGIIYDNASKVGISTASPQAQLHIYAGTTAGDHLLVESTNTAAGDAPDLVLYRNSPSPANSDDLGIIRFRGKNNGTDTGYGENKVIYADIEAEITSVVSGAEGAALKFYTQDNGSLASRMVITGANIGIGTATPAVPLHITKSAVGDNEIPEVIRLSTLNSASPNWSTTDGLCIGAEMKKANGTTITKQPIRFRYDGGDMATTFEEGKVGIGTNTPAAKLDLRSSDSVVAYIIRPSASPTVHIGSATSAGAQLGYVHAHDYAFYGHDAAYNAIVVKSDGKVGIGTTDPDTKLHVEDSTSNTTATKIRVQGGSLGFTLGKAQTADHYAHLRPLADNAMALRVMPNGTTVRESYVEVWNKDYENGANSTSWHRGMFYIDTSNDVYLRADGYGTAGSVFIGTENNTQTLMVKDGGKVAIGTNTPDANHDLTIANTANYGIRLTGTNATIQANANLIATAGNNIYLRPGSGYQVIQDAGKGLSVVNTSNDAAGIFESRENGGVAVVKLRAKDLSAPSTALPGDQGAALQFQGWDGDSFETMATIFAATEGAAANGDIPSSLRFLTTPDGAAAATEKMRIKSDGNVGIGTDAPAYTLDVAGDIGVNQYIRHNGDPDTHINFTDDDINFKVGNVNFLDLTQDTVSEMTVNEAGANLDVRIEGDTDANLFFTDASTDKVGIGTNAPASKLHVAASSDDGIKINSNNAIIGQKTTHATHGTQLLFWSGTDAYLGRSISGLGNGTVTSWNIRTGGADTVIINSTGLGIGGISPSSKLHLYSATDANTIVKLQGGSDSAKGAHINFLRGATDLGSFGTKASLVGGTSNDLMFYSASNDFIYYSTAERMRVQADGKVGIGTNNPSELLEVRGNITIRGATNNRLKIANDSNNNWSEIGNDGATGENTLEFFTGSSSVASMSITNSKLVGIGTATPVYTLQANGTNGGIIGVTRTTGNTTGTLGHVRFGNTDVDSDLANIKGVQDGATDSARLEFETQATGGSATARLTIKSDGVVDINSAKLKINGGSGTDGQVLTTDGAGGIAWETSPGAGSVDGSGTANYIPKWTDGDTIGNSTIYTDGQDVAIGSTAFGVGGTIDLSVGSPGSTAGGITLWNTTTGVHSIGFGDANSGTARYEGYLEYSHADNSMRFGTVHAEQMRINNLGYVGINTTTPAIYLHNHGSALIGRTSGTTGSYVLSSYDLTLSNGNSGTVILLYNNAGAFHSGLIKYDTNCLKLGLNNSNSTNAILTTTAVNVGSVGVGIGTDDPGSKLEVYAASGLVASHVKSGTVISRLTANSTASDGVVGTSSAHDFLIQRAGSTRMTFGGSSVTINDNGENIDFRVEGDTDANLIRTDAANDRVGIGTNAPASLLHVGGAAASPHAAADDFVIAPAATDVGMTIRCNSNSGTGSIFFADTAATAQGTIRYNHNTDYMSFSSSGDYFFDTTNGSVGIGTITPGQRLDIINGAIRISSSGETKIFFRETVAADTYADRWTIGNDDAINNAFVFSTGANFASPKLVILEGGSVGIGTNNPSNRLHIEGTTLSNASIRIEKTTTGINEDPGLVLAAANNTDGYRIGSIFFQGGATSYAQIRAEMNGTAGAKIYFVAGSQTNPVSNSSTKTLEIEDGIITAATAIRPLTDSSYTLGQASLKWSELYVDKIKDVNNSTGSANQILSAGGSGGSLDWVSLSEITGVDGSGTANTIPRWTDSDTIGDSIITVPSNTSVQVAGPLTATGNITVGPSNNSKIYMGGNDYIAFTDGVGDGFKFVYDNTERLRITNTGNVGVGVTDPDAKLEIKGTAGSTGLAFKTTDSSSNNTFWIQDGGKAGLHYYPFVINQDNSDTDCPASTFFYVHHATAPFIIKNDGKVGVGTAAPAEKLHVSNGSSSGDGVVYPLRLSGGAQMATNGDATGIKFIQRDQYNDYGGYIRLANTASNPGYLNPRFEFGVQNTNTNVFGSVSTKMVITGGGSVGIGTDTPDSKLEIAGGGYNSSLKIKGSGGDTGIQFEDSAGNTDGYIYAEGTSIGFLDAGGSWMIQCKNDDFLRFSVTSDTERMRIKSDGNVGIGTDDPAATLQVNKTAAGEYMRVGSGATRELTFTSYTAVSDHAGHKINASSGNGEIRLQTNTTDRLTITSGGNVGIGTVTPGAPAHIFSNGTTNTPEIVLCLGANTANIPALQFSENTNAGFNTGMSIQYRGDYGAGDANALGIHAIGADATTSGAAVATFKSGGNVGIGTTNPTCRLQLDYGANPDPDGTDVDVLKIGSTVGSGYEEEFRIKWYSGAGDLAYIGGSHTDPTAGNDKAYLSFGTRTSDVVSERVRIDHDGNVGIGTTAPAKKLEVNFTGDDGVQIQNTGSSHASIWLDGGTGGVGAAYLRMTSRDGTSTMTHWINLQSNGNLVFRPAATGTAANQIIFNQNGSIGIGGTPTSGNKLFVNGNSFLDGTAYVDDALTVDGYINFDTMGDYLTFYGNANAHHSISSRSSAGSANDDIRINTYGALFINLDSNGNDSSESHSSFQIGRHAGTGAVSASDLLLNLSGETGKLRLYKYGSGTHTGTAEYKLSVDSSGNVIETAIGAGAVDGSGTANKVTKWTDTDTIGDSQITDNGTSVGINQGSPNAANKLEVSGTATCWRQLISAQGYTQAPVGVLTIQGPTSGGTTINSDVWGLVVGPQHTRSSTANTYYAGIAFNHLLNHGGSATYNNAPQAWIGTRLHDTSGSERDFLVFATKSGTGTTASDVPVERMCIDPAAGHVGIGTTDPAYILDVYETGSNLGIFRSTATNYARLVIRSGSAGDAQLAFQNSTSTKWSIGNDGGDSDKFKIAVGSGAFSTSEAVTISTSGCVGIGTNSPLEPLHVYDAGDWQIRTSSGGNRSGLVIDKPGTTSIMGSVLVLSDETYRLGTASYYHMIMYQGGATYLLHQGNTKIQTTATGVTVTGTLTETSSITLKENVETYTPSLDIINKIRPVKYNRKTNKDKKEIGLIAEELAELFPELVEKDEKGNPSSVNYSRAVTVLLGGFKELYKEIEELKKRI